MVDREMFGLGGGSGGMGSLWAPKLQCPSPHPINKHEAIVALAAFAVVNICEYFILHHQLLTAAAAKEAAAIPFYSKLSCPAYSSIFNELIHNSNGAM